MIKNEPKVHKKIIKNHAICLLIISIVFWALYFARFDSTAKMQKRLNNNLKKLVGVPIQDYSYYDNDCLFGGKFPDDADAQEIVDL